MCLAKSLQSARRCEIAVMDFSQFYILKSFEGNVSAPLDAFFRPVCVLLFSEFTVNSKFYSSFSRGPYSSVLSKLNTRKYAEFPVIRLNNVTQPALSTAMRCAGWLVVESKGGVPWLDPRQYTCLSNAVWLRRCWFSCVSVHVVAIVFVVQMPCHGLIRLAL